MNKYIATIYDLDDNQMNAYLVKTNAGATQREIELACFESLRNDGIEDVEDLRVEIVDLNEDMYEVIDLRKANNES